MTRTWAAGDGHSKLGWGWIASWATAVRRLSTMSFLVAAFYDACCPFYQGRITVQFTRASRDLETLLLTVAVPTMVEQGRVAWKLPARHVKCLAGDEYTIPYVAAVWIYRTPGPSLPCNRQFDDLVVYLPRRNLFYFAFKWMASHIVQSPQHYPRETVCSKCSTTVHSTYIMGSRLRFFPVLLLVNIDRNLLVDLYHYET